MENLMKLKLDSNRIFLDGTEIKGLKSYNIKASSEDCSVLNMTLYVDTFGDKEEQDVSNKKRDKPSVEDGIKVDSKELDINEIASRMSSNILKQLNESRAGEARMKEDVSNKKRVNGSIDIKVDSKKLDEAIEKANQLTELLGEAQKIVDSLSNKRCTSDKDRVLEAFILASKEIIEENKTELSDKICIDRVVERLNKFAKKELGTETPSLKELLDSLDKNLKQTVCREAFKIYYTTKDENIALEALRLLSKVAQHF